MQIKNLERVMRLCGLGAVLFLSISCDSGGGLGVATNSDGEVLSGVSAGYSVPSEVSAVPASGSGSSKPVTVVEVSPGGSGSNKAVGGIIAGLNSVLLGAATDPGTDYSNAKTVKFVNEQALEHFDIIEQVLNAVGQTHYADADNINQGPYKAMVAWEEEHNGIEVKQMQPWVVDSRMIVENGQDVNRVLAWIEFMENGQTELIKAEFKIYQSATQNDDGSYEDFGVWNLNVSFGTSGEDFFVASATIENGVSVVKYHDYFPSDDGNRIEQHKAIMHRSGTSGHGKILYPDWWGVDWGNCGQNCFPEEKESTYAYNTDYLGVKEGSNTPRYVSRTSGTEMTHRYGVFNDSTGRDVRKDKTWGFPVEFTVNGVRQHGYYGAWQGRHQLWGGAQGTIPPGTDVTRQEFGSNQTGQTYKVSAPFRGTLVKRTTVTASLNDVKNIPVETWVNEFYNLVFNSSDNKWYNCKNPSWGQNGMTCGSTPEDFTNMLPTLEVSSNDNRKWVNINRWDNQQNKNYVYLTIGPSGAGFYEATQDQSTMRFTSTGVKYNPSNNDHVWASVGGSIYIMYNGTSWVEKTLLSFDSRTWTPKFDDSNKPYTLPLNQELYMNVKGANYIVKRTDSGHVVKMEIQTVANPVNASTFVDSGTVFKSPWNPDNDSTFEFVTDPADSATFLKLVYLTIGQNDKNNQGQPNQGVEVGGVVTRGLWGIEAYVDGEATDTQFNWDYPREGDNWGILTYLIDSNQDYVIVDDPIRFVSVQLTKELSDSNPETKTMALQFDGWMHGLPDMFEELRKSDFNMTADLKDKIWNIPAGTLLTDASDSTIKYRVKPLETSVFLDVVSDTTGLTLPDLTAAQAIDLNSVPTFTAPIMGAIPTTSGIKYSEGKLVQ